ncbi:MAG TPA: low molecular weight protein-tyrosine-phosphatase [Cyclobacteriaceae bacterium]|nr:low molecular weight protein-tyrosine-phosphatase [Cyclobacteriaceae bacterium]
MFVCLGNICRSPLAEAIFNHKVKNRGLEKVIIADSSGTSHWHIGDLPDPRTIETAAGHGIQINHRGRQFKPDDTKIYDYIIAMDKDNRVEIDSIMKNRQSKARVLMMGDFDRNSSGTDIPDPYYGDKMDFQEVFRLLDESCENLVKYLVDTHHPDDKR